MEPQGLLEWSPGSLARGFFLRPLPYPGVPFLKTNLPPLRRRIFLAYILIVAVYASALAAFVLSTASADAGIFHKIITRNYDSIKAARLMDRDWRSSPFTPALARDLEDELRFARANITEPGEREAVASLRKAWDLRRAGGDSPDLDKRFDSALGELVRVNELGMHHLADQASHQGRRELEALLWFSAATLLLTLLIARRLARGLSRPLIQISSELSRPRGFEEPLVLPESGSRELEVLRLRLEEWWDQARRLQQVNVDEILAQRNKLEAVFASVEDAVLLLDGAGRVSQLNRRGCALLGASPETAPNRPFEALAAETENGRALLRWLKGPRGEGTALEMSHEGRPRLFAVRERSIVAAEGVGGAASRLLLLQDVTERRQRERLEDEFIGVLSHELKTPLQSLGMAAELMEKRRDRLDPSLHVFLDTILDDLRRIRSVANDFVQVSQLNVRSIRLNLETVALAGKLREWLRPFELLAAEKGVGLILEGGAGSGLCRLDPVKFSWVVSNLLSNALRVSLPGHRVTVTVEDQTLFVEMQVRDEGPGIPPEVERRMFEPYFQGPPENQAAGLLGLGLTIAKEVVEAHEGAIEYYRGESGGSVFRVLLPVAPRPHAELAS